MDNLTIITEFILMDIASSREIQILQGLLFLVIYLGALAGNLLTVMVIVIDPHLHFPMYFFIANLSIVDFCYISVTVPKSIVNSLTGRKSISLPECVAQIFLYSSFAALEYALLIVMSYDRYVAICQPLHYGIVVTPHMCAQAAGGSWVCGLVYSAMHTGTIFSLPFTKSNVIYQYFCDIPQLLRISSSHVQFSEYILIAVSSVISLICFAFLFTSYVKIFSTVFKMRSEEARNKALFTCTPQLVILVLFMISILMAALSPVSNKASLRSLLIAMFYNMVPPVMNPIVFSLRNKEINSALGRMFNRYFVFTSRNVLDSK
ncbi:PREDICTED: olfactory receptor 14I1-like [Elephantulus edwardii]|uniref:olfactory receptor 14I1-like n=1 Tax=Elephantulus edwardii TaxID=28737 RepID=UPI0003F09C89|nr:PREDICTED: olfactory receptor 14I1-like [Elephantulus edwardii]